MFPQLADCSISMSDRNILHIGKLVCPHQRYIKLHVEGPTTMTMKVCAAHKPDGTEGMGP